MVCYAQAVGFEGGLKRGNAQCFGSHRCAAGSCSDVGRGTDEPDVLCHIGEIYSGVVFNGRSLRLTVLAAPGGLKKMASLPHVWIGFMVIFLFMEQVTCGLPPAA